MSYIYNNKKWPRFTWDPERLVRYLSTARYKQGLLLGKMQDLGYQLKSEATLAALTEETVKSSAIEGEQLNSDSADPHWLGGWDSKQGERDLRIGMSRASLK